MNATDNYLQSRNRFGSLAAVTAVHILLGLMLLYAMHKPIRHTPTQELVVTLLANPKPSPVSVPVPLAMAKRVMTSMTLPELPLAPQIEVNIPQDAPAAPPPAKQIAQETHVEPVKEIAAAGEDADRLSTPMQRVIQSRCTRRLRALWASKVAYS